MPSLCLNPVRRPGALRVAVIGRLDRQTAAAFTEHMSVLLRQSDTATNSVVLDLRCCTTMDADGAAALAGIRTAVDDAGGLFHLEGVPPLIEYVARLSTPPSPNDQA